MKKILFTLMAMLTMSISAQAMSFEQAQREALFLTDKMAYELNLTQEQYDAAYEINLDYLMGVTSVDDVYGTYWSRRNLDLSYILLDWQWSAFQAATYFYRPLYWDAGYWHFGVYARYPRRSYFYFDRPGVYISYRGGHSWRMNGGRSWYHDRRGDFHRGNDNHFGIRDRWNRGDFNRGSRDFGRGSSTRVTVNGNRGFNNNNNRGFNNNNNRGFNNNNNRNGNRIENNRNRGSFGNNRNGNRIENSRINRGSFGGTNHSSSSSNHSNVGSRSGSIGNHSNGGGNHSNGGGSHSNNGGGSHSSGGSHFGGGSHSGGGFGGGHR